jgi:predicted nuclease of predicted toxin-antitoxin system
MKLLLDENLSRRIISFLQEDFPGSSQVALLGLNESSDQEIWEYAEKNGYVIVTQDADFHEQSIMKGGPPLVVWLRCGNQSNQSTLEKLVHHKSLIAEAAKDKQIWCIEIY